MRYAIFTRGDLRSQTIKNTIVQAIAALPDFVEDVKPDVVIFIGGDGTFLRAVQMHLNRIEEVTFIGVHTGTLGFFCDYAIGDLTQLIADLPNAASRAHSYRLLQVQRTSDEGQDMFYAVNEIRLENPFHTLVSDVAIDGLLLETFRGNGLIVSSTLGSSAYNKSLGGALINTSVESLQLTEVATLQNNAFRSLGSSLVLGANQTVTLTGRFQSAVIGYDHLVIDDGRDVRRLDITLSQKHLRIVHQNNRKYTEILRKSFIKD